MEEEPRHQPGLENETVVNLRDVDYMVFPRLPALAEVGWSAKVDRKSEQSPSYEDFIGRLAAQGARFLASGVNFYPTPEVPCGSTSQLAAR